MIKTLVEGYKWRGSGLWLLLIIKTLVVDYQDFGS